jgi:hypothetical protein
LLTVLVGLSAAQTQSSLLSSDELALQIAGRSGSSVERTQKLVDWINTNFSWTVTDYEQRTADQIIARRAGNCAELSKVLVRLLQPTGIRYRWVAEINVQPSSPRRQETAARLVQGKGNTYSVFGLRHNDHRWLEIYDDGTKQWIPADPSIGLVGVNPWVAFRMGLYDRPRPPVADVAEIAQDMIVPFAVIALKDDLNSQEEDRSEFYLIDQFDAAYGGKLGTLPAWNQWTSQIRRIAPLASAAFAGKSNLHESSEKIAQLAETYAELQKQAEASRIPAIKISSEK